MINFFKSSLLFKIILGLVSVYTAYITFADPPGYCSTQQRYIPDEEFIQIAIRREKTSMNIDGSEESIRTFHVKNPDCCTVNRRQTQYLSRFLLTAVNSVEVFFQYEMSEQKTAQYLGDKYYDAWVIIDVCGKELDTYGISKEHYYHAPKTKKEQS